MATSLDDPISTGVKITQAKSRIMRNGGTRKDNGRPVAEYQRPKSDGRIDATRLPNIHGDLTGSDQRTGQSSSAEVNISNLRSHADSPVHKSVIKLERNNTTGSGPSRKHKRGFRNNKLTNVTSDAQVSTSKGTQSGHYLEDDSLVSRLARSLSKHPYADCPICFLPIRPTQSLWSCSPDVSLRTSDTDIHEVNSQCCYTPFHLKCILSWSTKSIHDTREAYIARGDDRPGEWRCPACQKRRSVTPQFYTCFCGAVTNPQAQRLATPHSCASPCARPRLCGHRCPLQCHPGPCPPCHIVTQLYCFCRRQLKSFRCHELVAADLSTGFTCGQLCQKALKCGKHFCQSSCHEGECPPCVVTEYSKCYCGKVERELTCAEAVEIICTIDVGSTIQKWTGRFVCGTVCERVFDCGIHKCPKICHPPSNLAPVCPFSPSVVTHCPCGKTNIKDLDGPRKLCTDAISTCRNSCEKPLDGCDHLCAALCHTGPCPPCSIEITLSCRCGSMPRSILCCQRSAPQNLEILCENKCSVLRSCGRHQCNRVCCPLASLTLAMRGKKKTRGSQPNTVDDEGWHDCDLICGKLLSCGNHRCEERDHRGVCPPCLNSSFSEIACHCGKTIMEPPVPCGTVLACPHPCVRPPSCGHPETTHSCHDNTVSCPPCPFLTSKICACGKTNINNVRCSQSKVSCGTKCGRLLDCGFHHCERFCHSDGCEPCEQICGKPRRLCMPASHSCVMPCHAPASCSEVEPCRASIVMSCPCGRIQQPTLCGRCIAQPAGRDTQQHLECTNQCQIAKRNARLAEALGISGDVRDRESGRPVNYSDDLLHFAKRDAKFCELVEKTFLEFIDSEKRSLVLPRMPAARRGFVSELAAIYCMDIRLVDAEPHRSVQIIRRIDTRIPKPLLSTAANTFRNQLGKLVDLREQQCIDRKHS